MMRVYKVFRAIVMALIALAVFVPSALYVVLSSETVADKLRAIAQDELSSLLGTEVRIGYLGVRPFNSIDIRYVTVADDYGKTALTATEIDARFEFWNFIATRRLVFDYAVVNGVEINLYKETRNSPLNIEGIIERLRSDEQDNKPKRFDLSLYTLRFTDASARFDVLDSPKKEGHFDSNHIALQNLNLLATAPVISDTLVSGKLRHVSFDFDGGFSVKNLKAEVEFANGRLVVNDPELNLSQTHLAFGNFETALPYTDSILNLNILKGSYFTLSDFAVFVPKFKDVNRRFNLFAEIEGNKEKITVDNLSIGEVTDGGFFFDAKGAVAAPLNPDSLTIENLRFSVEAYPLSVDDLLRRMNVEIPRNTWNIVERAGKTSVKGTVDGTRSNLRTNIEIESAAGQADIDASLKMNSAKSYDVYADVELEDFKLGRLMGWQQQCDITGSVVADLSLNKAKLPYGTVNLDLTSDFETLTKSHRTVQHQGACTLQATLTNDGGFDGHVAAEVDKGTILSSFAGKTSRHKAEAVGKVSVAEINLHDLGIVADYRGYDLDVDVDFDVKASEESGIEGTVDIRDLNYRSGNPEQKSLMVNRFYVNANNSVTPNEISVNSDFINGTVQGEVDWRNLVGDIKNLLSGSIPALIGKPNASFMKERAQENNFRFAFEIDKAENVVEFFRLPVAVIYPLTVEGNVNATDGQLGVSVDAPYLMKGDMIIEQTTVEALVDAEQGKSHVFLTTQFPTKKGPMSLTGGILAVSDTVLTKLDWAIEREKPINGQLSLSTFLSRDPDSDKLCAQATFLPSEIRFGNDLWKFTPSTITYRPGVLKVDNFGLATESQSIAINGECLADNPQSAILIDLDKVVLNTIFETLDINKALIGGVATGQLCAGGIFSEQPFVTCDNLHVQDIGYNNCVLGEGDIKTHWDNEKKSFNLDAIITQEDGKKSYIKGDIFPTTESLDISFDADNIKVGFMKPFMDAFAADVTGYASGHARIFGTFKYIDMEGDVYARDLGLKVGFTNTWYYATDSIHIVPGLIEISNVTVRDVDGHTALLNGTVKHTFFKDPVFDFRVTKAEDFLCYDVTPALSPDWYGKIYGNGSAFITGSPGVVNIDVNMTTAENSVFTFVLSDTEEAEQYNFITFRDKNRNVVTDSIIQKEILPEAVLAYRDKILRQAQEQNPPSVYNMNIQMDVTPDAKVIIVMDPVGGDEIKSWGKGNLRMTYTSVGNELRMYGTYAIDRGSYNFTLQDIIVKDFIINEGSSITFTGDPYNAMLDIKATYVVNANLSDLDESFINDPELNRTNVPVHALLIVRGDMRQPDIDFDLEFPTLTSDIYRKVRSIISTDEMMNRQMIYLLALNRFYTPEYMSATKGNELFSVASSTISSRLSSMLGKLSENWTISPNLRSDRGDFSDVQFDVALSSNLLNNRLRMNGNFGYRDKSLNTTQFIGDFDLEYLINRSGTWRLKAYNRFNDQTYFLRTAKTTQGVGLKFQTEFDNMFGFLRPKKKKEDGTEGESTEKESDEAASKALMDKTGTDEEKAKSDDKKAVNGEEKAQHAAVKTEAEK